MLYIPPHFRVTDVAVLHAHIRTIGFGSLTTIGKDGGLLISHFPVILDTSVGPFGQLRCHVARAMFMGPDAYVSPSWYPSKHEHGKAVPTWNYATVCARGMVEVYDDRDQLHAHVKELTGLHEAAFAEPWQVSDAPVDYLERQLKGIVGFRITIDALEGKMKLSQNRSDADRTSVAGVLQASEDANAHEVGEMMQAANNN